MNKASNLKKPKFSLRFLLLIVVIAGLSAGLWKSRKSESIQRMSADSLASRLARYEGGGFSLGGNDQFIAVPIASTVDNPLHWRWRVHVPESQSVELCVSAYDIPVNGVVDATIADSRGKRFVGQPIPSGDVLIDFAVFPIHRQKGKYHYSVSVDNDTLYSGVFDTFYPDLKLDTKLSVRKETAWKANSTPVLLHARYENPEARQLGKPRSNACHGFSFWIRNTPKNPEPPAG